MAKIELNTDYKKIKRIKEEYQHFLEELDIIRKERNQLISEYELTLKKLKIDKTRKDIKKDTTP